MPPPTRLSVLSSIECAAPRSHSSPPACCTQEAPLGEVYAEHSFGSLDFCSQLGEEGPQQDKELETFVIQEFCDQVRVRVCVYECVCACMHLCACACMCSWG